jgi:hypothetical protein
MIPALNNERRQVWEPLKPLYELSGGLIHPADFINEPRSAKGDRENHLR